MEVKGKGAKDVKDMITFFVRPPETIKAKAALVLSTFTYLA
jgi:hypothetical protein